MAGAIGAIQDGYKYQARVFWLTALALLSETGQAQRVGFEHPEVKSFDDVVVEYARPVPDSFGGEVDVDFVQLKYHRNATGRVTCEALTDPAFIGATSESLLKKLKVAVEGRGADPRCRFILRQHWTVAADDPLAEIYDNRTSALRLDVLFNGTTDKSKMGRVRKRWREHLQVDDATLKHLLGPLRLKGEPYDLDALREQLNDRFRGLGLKAIPADQKAFLYDDLIWTLFNERSGDGLMFTRETLLSELSRQGLYDPSPVPIVVGKRLGVRSFMPMAADLADRVDAMIALEHHFDGRHIRDPLAWSQEVYPALRDFFEDHMSEGHDCDLALETHTTTAFAAGHAAAKARGQVSVQVGRLVMRPTGQHVPTPLWTVHHQELGDGMDTAVAMSVTHDVSMDVRTYISRAETPFGHLVTCTLYPAPGPHAVLHGDHAVALAQDLVKRLRELRPDLPPRSRLHLFFAAPNFLTFEVGRLGLTLGPVQLYEFDRDAGEVGAYHPSLVLPLT